MGFYHFPLRMAIYDSSSSSWSLEYLISLGHRSLGNLGSSGSGSTSHNSRMESMVSVGGSKSSSPLGAILHSKGTLGYTACVGIVLLLIASRSRDRRLTDSDEQDGNESEESGGESASSSLYQFVFDSLSRLRDLFISSRSGEDYDREEDLDGETFVVHQGSCHCGAIAFEVSAPFILQVEELAGKLLYPSVRVPESSFRLLRGEAAWQTYQVPDQHTPATQAFSFCSRCAVHLVHAIDSDPFMVSFNVHCLTTPWKKAKSRKGKSAFHRVSSRSKKRSTVPRSPANRSTNSQSRGTPNSRAASPPPPPARFPSNSSSPISFDSKLTDSPTPPEDDGPVKEVVKTGPAAPFLSKEDSLSVASDNYSFGNTRPVGGGWRDDEIDEPNPFRLRRKPRYNGPSSVTDWPTDTTDTSSYLYADDENSLYESSVTSSRTEPLPPTVGGTPRNDTAGISSNFALRAKLRSNLSKHMKHHKTT